MKLLAGTSGYSYKEWKGSFYPSDMAADGMLRFYGTRLPAVEINNTFYRLPKASVLQGWAEQVPETFRFALKASRRITHIKRLKDAGSETSYLLETAQTLGPRLGVILFQLPPNFKKDLPRLADFIGGLDPQTRAVFEFRHETWFDDEVFDLLRQRRCALCMADDGEGPVAPLVATAPFGYLRLRREVYSPEEMAEWARRVAAQPWDEAYVFFKHEDEATGPAAAAQFLEIAKWACRTHALLEQESSGAGEQ